MLFRQPGSLAVLVCAQACLHNPPPPSLISHCQVQQRAAVCGGLPRQGGQNQADAQHARGAWGRQAGKNGNTMRCWLQATGKQQRGTEVAAVVV